MLKIGEIWHSDASDWWPMNVTGVSVFQVIPRLRGMAENEIAIHSLGDKVFYVDNEAVQRLIYLGIVRPASEDEIAHFMLSRSIAW